MNIVFLIPNKVRIEGVRYFPMSQICIFQSTLGLMASDLIGLKYLFFRKVSYIPERGWGLRFKGIIYVMDNLE